MIDLEDGYYLAYHTDGTTFVVLRESGCWYCCGVGHSIRFDKKQIIRRLETE